MIAKKAHIGSSDPATKGDLEELREDLQVDMVNMEERLTKRIDSLDTKIDGVESRLEGKIDSLDKKMDEWGERILTAMDVAVENRLVDAGMGKAEHVQLNSERIDRLEARVSTLEQH